MLFYDKFMNIFPENFFFFQFPIFGPKVIYSTKYLQLFMNILGIYVGLIWNTRETTHGNKTHVQSHGNHPFNQLISPCGDINFLTKILNSIKWW